MTFGAMGLGGYATGLAAARSPSDSGGGIYLVSQSCRVMSLDLTSQTRACFTMPSFAPPVVQATKWSWPGMKSIATALSAKKVTPLHKSRGALIVEHKNNGDGSFSMTRREVAFHCDIETNEVIDKR